MTQDKPDTPDHNTPDDGHAAGPADAAWDGGRPGDLPGLDGQPDAAPGDAPQFAPDLEAAAGGKWVLIPGVTVAVVLVLAALVWAFARLSDRPAEEAAALAVPAAPAEPALPEPPAYTVGGGVLTPASPAADATAYPVNGEPDSPPAALTPSGETPDAAAADALIPIPSGLPTGQAPTGNTRVAAADAPETGQPSAPPGAGAPVAGPDATAPPPDATLPTPVEDAAVAPVEDAAPALHERLDRLEQAVEELKPLIERNGKHLQAIRDRLRAMEAQDATPKAKADATKPVAGAVKPKAKTPPAPPDLWAIRTLGGYPTALLVDAAGARHDLTPGGSCCGGWTLAAVTDDGVTLVRGADRRELML